MEGLKLGLIQMEVSNSKEDNLIKAEQLTKQAVSKGAQLVVLPEMFNCPYNTENFPKYAEVEGGPSWHFLARLASDNHIYLCGGSIPEIDEAGKVFNTSYIFNDGGQQIAKHRKVHLFDIDIQDGQYFKESDTLSAGDKPTVFNTPYGKVGVMICYDIRFPELARVMVEKGCQIVLVPGAFNMTTGPAHWEILFRTRALDNQVYLAGCAPARNLAASYISYGHSLITSPWGKIVCNLEDKEGVLVEELDLSLVGKIRQELPLLKHRRPKIYNDK